MFQRQNAHLDLATVRETLLYMRDDLARDPELRRAAALLEAAIAEIETVESRTGPRSEARAMISRFIPLSRTA